MLNLNRNAQHWFKSRDFEIDKVSTVLMPFFYTSR